MYDLLRAWFTTPGGRRVVMYLRADTNDWNTCVASLDEDEYGLKGLRLSGHAIDIGGYLGTVSVALLVDNPGLRVTCVEPVPDNCELIRRNAAANGVTDRLTLIEGAAGADGRDVMVRYRFGGNAMDRHHAFVGNSTITDPEAPHLSRTYRAVTLGELSGGEPVAFLKIDCEGGEFDILTDPAVGVIADIVGEWHNVPLPDGTTGSRDRIRSLLQPTHVLTFSGPEEGPGGFRGVRR